MITATLNDAMKKDALALNEQMCRILEKNIDCLSAEQTLSVSDSCPTIWNYDLCWPAALFNTTSYLPCPVFSQEANNETENFVSLHCNATLRNWNPRITHDGCYPTLSDDVLRNASEKENITNISIDEDDPYLVILKEEQRHQILFGFATAGFSLSLVSLFIGVILFFVFKRLHCTRVYIHINLMIAQMLRAIIWFVSLGDYSADVKSETEMDAGTVFLVHHVIGRFNSSSLNDLLSWKKDYCDPYRNLYIGCQVSYVMSNYASTATYYWLLVEGLYLALILCAKRPNDYQNVIMKVFLVFGWVLPWISVIGNLVAKLLDPEESARCWYLETTIFYWWIIKIPILISVLINFVILIWVVRVVGSKLKVNQRHHADNKNEDYKLRLAKSTLALVPLLGIQYILTAPLSFLYIKDLNVKFVYQAVEMMLTSIQGFLIALIYCFLNKEVQEELKRCWRTWKAEWEIEGRKRAKSTTPATSLMNLYSCSVTRKHSDRIVKPGGGGEFTPDNSPMRTRFSSMVSDTTRLSPYSVRKSVLSQASTATSPLLESVLIKETRLDSDSMSMKSGSTASPYGSKRISYSNRASQLLDDGLRSYENNK